MNPSHLVIHGPFGFGQQKKTSKSPNIDKDHRRIEPNKQNDGIVHSHVDFIFLLLITFPHLLLRHCNAGSW